jgi:hypothetical protein
MNKYLVKFNYHGEITEMKTTANSHYQAILNCLSIMAKRYGVTKNSMITYFDANKLNHEVKEIKLENKEET